MLWELDVVATSRAEGRAEIVIAEKRWAANGAYYAHLTKRRNRKCIKDVDFQTIRGYSLFPIIIIKV